MDRFSIYWLAANFSAFSLTEGEALPFLAGSAVQVCKASPLLGLLVLSLGGGPEGDGYRSACVLQSRLSAKFHFGGIT